MKKYWYFITIHECPVCGGGKTYRERRYTDKPTDPFQRYRYEQFYDYCLDRGWLV